MDLTKWFTVTTLCALMLMFDAVLHDGDCEFMYLFDMRRMALLFIINIRNFAYSHGINRHATLYFKFTIICVKERFLHTAMILCSALLCLCFVSVIYVTWKVMSLLQDYTVQPSDHQRSYFVEHTTVPGHPDSKLTVILMRSEGEDMEMSCLNIDVKGTWLFNGEPVNESSRVYNFRSNTKNGSVDLLRIHSLQHGEFGTYSFVVLKKTAYERNGVIQSRNKFVLYSTTLCKYILREDVQRVETVMVPHGGQFIAPFNYYLFSDEEYLYVDVTVNGQPVDLVCGPWQEGCSSLLRYFEQDTWTHLTHYAVEPKHLKLVHVISQMCMCPKAFGNHSVSYFRRHFNHEKGISELIEIQNTKTYFVEPLRSPFLNWIIDVLGWDKPTADSTTMNEYTLEEMALYSKAIELCVFIFVAVLYIITGVLTALYFMVYIVTIILHLYYLHTIINTSRRNKSRNTQTYILCCEEDTRWSVQNIDPVIKEVGHATFIHSRDSHPGQTDVEGIRTGMRMCQTLVIVVSQCAVQDPMWVYQVDVVLDRLVRREVSSFNVLVVRVDGARHPVLEEVISVRTMRTIIWEKGNSQDQYVQARNEDVMCWLFACDPHLYLENV